MFIFIFFISLSLVTYFYNKFKNIDENNIDSYNFNNGGKWALLGLFTLSIIFEIIFKFLPKDFIIYGYPITFFIYISILFIANDIRINKIEEKRNQILQIYEVLGNLFKDYKNKNIEIDYNNIPFEYKLEKGEIIEIIVEIKNYNLFTDKNVTNSMYSLNKYLPNRNWSYNIDLSNKICVFTGNKHSPTFALYPGSDLKPWNWIPTGISAEGELGWNLGAKENDIGRSMFYYEDEDGSKIPAETINVSSAPQALTVGSSGGGKAIEINQKIYK